MKQAMTDFFTGLPRLIATSGILGAGGEHIAHSGGKQAQTEQTQSQTEIPHPTTEDAAGPSGQPSPTTANNTSSEAELRRVDGQPSSTSPLSTAKPSTPPLDVETSKKLIENVSKMPAAAQQNSTTQANVAQAKGVVVADAQKRIDNISQMRPEAQQNPKVQKDLAEAQKTVEDHGQKPGDQAGALSDAQAAEAPAGPATSTHSSGGSLPPRDTSTTHGATPPTGTATGSHAGTGDTESPTSTASSRDSNAPGGGTHTTNGVTAPEIGHGNPIPENTTHKEHIDLANRRVKHLEEIARKRPLSEHEQGIYDNARRVRDRNAPTQPGDRNNGNPKDLAMAGDADALVPVTPDGEDAHLDASADTPPAAAPAQGPDAVGSTVQGSGTPNPDAPTASAASYPTPPPAGPAGVSAGTQVPAPTPASPSSENPVSATTAASASPALSGSSAGGASPSTGSNSSPSSPSPASVSPAGNGAGSTQPPSYPPIDHSHTIGAEINRRNQATGGHSLLRGDVAIIPGTETDPNAQGVYQARVQMRHPVTGAWIPKTSNGGMNTMFPKHWTEAQIRSEVDAAWNSPHKVIDPTTRIWRAPSPSGIIIEGYINPHRVTAYPKL